MSIAKAKGVDVSSSNGGVDMSKIKKAGYKFVMIRCGYGDNSTSQDDCQFETNVKKAEKLGLPWGVYIYSYATNTTEAKSEVEHVKRLLKGKKPTMPIAFDMEDADGYKGKRGAMKKTLITDICKTFLSEIKKAGYYPMLYCSRSWLDTYIDSSVYSKYDLWVAQWSTSCSYKGKNLGMWQYGGEVNYIESNSISGVGVIDKDKCYKDYTTIIKKGGYNNWTKPKKKPKTVKFKKSGALYSKPYKDVVGGASKPQAAMKKGNQVEWISDNKKGWSKVKYKGKIYYVINGNLNKLGLSSFKTITLKREYVGFKVTPKNTRGEVLKIKKDTKVKVICVIDDGKYKNWSYGKIKGQKYYIKDRLL